jgi:flagellar motor switch protein FliN/FliY
MEEVSETTETAVDTTPVEQDAGATAPADVVSEQPVTVPTPPSPSQAHRGSLGKLADVTLEVTVELGRAQLPVRELLALDEGGVIRLEHPVGEPVNLLVNGLQTARGEIVVVDGRIGLRVTEVVE